MLQSDLQLFVRAAQFDTYLEDLNGDSEGEGYQQYMGGAAVRF